MPSLDLQREQQRGIKTRSGGPKLSLFPFDGWSISDSIIHHHGSRSWDSQSQYLSLIRAINTKMQEKEINGIIKDIHQISSVFNSISFSFLPRSLNQEANELAKRIFIYLKFRFVIVMGPQWAKLFVIQFNENLWLNKEKGNELIGKCVSVVLQWF